MSCESRMYMLKIMKGVEVEKSQPFFITRIFCVDILNAEKRIVNVRFTQKVSGCGSWRKQQYEIIQYRRSGGHGRRDDAKCR